MQSRLHMITVHILAQCPEESSRLHQIFIIYNICKSPFSSTSSHYCVYSSTVVACFTIHSTVLPHLLWTGRDHIGAIVDGLLYLRPYRCRLHQIEWGHLHRRSLHCGPTAVLLQPSGCNHLAPSDRDEAKQQQQQQQAETETDADMFVHVEQCRMNAFNHALTSHKRDSLPLEISCRFAEYQINLVVLLYYYYNIIVVVFVFPLLLAVIRHAQTCSQ